MSYITYDAPTEAECIGASSESAKYRHLTAPYLAGVGADIGSQGSAVVPWAFSLDLPEPLFSKYSGGNPPKGPIHIRGSVDSLPFGEKSLDFIYCSHVIEDFDHRTWPIMFRHWASKIKSGGVIVVLVPEVKLWAEALAKGQPPNCSHWAPEPSLGELTVAAQRAGLKVEKEELTSVYPGDYTIMGVFRVP